MKSTFLQILRAGLLSNRFYKGGSYVDSHRNFTGIAHSAASGNRISEEIEKSRELFRGFTGKKSGKDICEFLEESFTQKEIKLIFGKMEASFLLSEDAAEEKYLTLPGYFEVIADEIFSKLIRELREIEQKYILLNTI